MDGPIQFHSYKVYQFKGRESSFIEIPKQPNLNMDAISCTYLMYIYVTQKNDVPLLEYIKSNGGYGFHLGLFPYWSRLHFASGGSSFKTVTMFGKAQTWYFFGFTYNRSSENLTLWRDGELVSESTFSSTNWTMNGFIRLGMRKNYIYFDGSIACLTVYAEVLSAKEIKEAQAECLHTLSKGERI